MNYSFVSMVIHNSTKPTGLIYRSASQPFLSSSPETEKTSTDQLLIVPNNLFIQSVDTSARLVESSGIIAEDKNSIDDIEEIDQPLEDQQGVDELDNEPNESSAPSTSDHRKYKKAKTSNFRNRISTKIRNKRIQAISKFRKINRRIRNKISDSGIDDISYISNDLNENNPDYVKQQIPRINKNGDTISADQLEGAAKLWYGKDYTNFIVRYYR